MTKKHKIILSGTGLVIAAGIIFGGQYLADQIKANREAELKAAAQTTTVPEATAPLTVDADMPIETEYVYDENGNVVIEPEEEPATADAEASPDTAEEKTTEVEASTPTTSAQESTASTSDTKASSTTTTAKASTSSSTTSTKSTTSSSDTSTASSSSTASSDSDSSSDNTASSDSSSDSSSSDHEGEVYVPGFGWMKSEGEGACIQMEDSGGDYNKVVGH